MSLMRRHMPYPSAPLIKRRSLDQINEIQKNGPGYLVFQKAGSDYLDLQIQTAMMEIRMMEIQTAIWTPDENNSSVRSWQPILMIIMTTTLMATSSSVEPCEAPRSAV